MRNTGKKSFLNWASHSLIGHVVLAQIAFSIPMLFVFRDSLYVYGALDFGRVLYVLTLAVGGGVAWAVLFWYTVSRSLIRRRDAEISGDDNL